MSYEEAAYYLNIIVLSLLICVGVAGNCLSMLTWSKGRHRRTSTAVLLTALALCNIIVLLLPCLEYWGQETWGRDTDYLRLRNLNSILCKTFAFSSYFAPTTTSWILVFVTFERVFSMWFPLRVRYMCTRCKVGIALLVLTITTAALYFPLLLATDIISVNKQTDNTSVAYTTVNSTPLNITLPDDDVRCDISLELFEWYFFPWRWLDMCVVFVVPFILIVIGNVMIIWKLLKRRTLGNVTKNGKAVLFRTRVANAFTVRAIALSISFCLFTSPVTIYAVMRDYVLYAEKENALVISCIHILFYANSSVNFFLYCAIGSGFKQDLRTVLRNLCRRRKVSIRTQNTSKYSCDNHISHTIHPHHHHKHATHV